MTSPQVAAQRVWQHRLGWRRLGNVDPNFGEMLDTSARNRERYYDMLRAMTPVQRLARAASLSRAVRGLALESIRAEHPDATPHELQVRLAVRLYGPELARRVYGEVPSDAR